MQRANTWKVTTQDWTYWYPTEEAAQLAAKGFALQGCPAVVTRDTSNRR
jgi:hypothetical protein